MVKKKESETALTEIDPPKSESLESVLQETVTEVSPASPIADMPQPETQPETQPLTQPETQPVKRGRKKLPRDAEGNIIRPDGSTYKPRPTLNGISQAAVIQQDAGIEPAAEVAVALVGMSGIALGGEQAIMQEQEKLLAKSGFVAYFKAKGIDNIPPWVILAGGLAPYYMRVLTATPAKSVVVRASEKMYIGIRNLFSRKSKNARSNSRDDTQRENDTSAETGEKSA